jgi:hypothetical protein
MKSNDRAMADRLIARLDRCGYVVGFVQIFTKVHPIP